MKKYVHLNDITKAIVPLLQIMIMSSLSSSTTTTTTTTIVTIGLLILTITITISKTTIIIIMLIIIIINLIVRCNRKCNLGLVLLCDYACNEAELHAEPK